MGLFGGSSSGWISFEGQGNESEAPVFLSQKNPPIYTIIIGNCSGWSFDLVFSATSVRPAGVGDGICHNDLFMGGEIVKVFFLFGISERIDDRHFVFTGYLGYPADHCWRTSFFSPPCGNDRVFLPRGFQFVPVFMV